MSRAKPTPKGQIDITFFVPCLNEEENIIPTLETVMQVAKENALRYEIIVIDDNSSDGTVRAIEDFQKKNSRISIRLIKNTIRKSVGYNYVEGAFAGSGEYYMAVFGDNSEPPESISTIVRNRGKADMIIPHFGDYDNRVLARRLTSRLFICMLNLASGYRLRYYNGPVLHKRYNVMRWHSDAMGFGYQAELLTRLLNNGATYQEVEITRREQGERASRAFTLQNFLSVTHSLLKIVLRRMRKRLYGI